MISQLRNTAFARILWGFMGLYFFNISVDAADPNPEHMPEDLSINEQENIVEIVLEKVLGYEDAIEEYDDHDTESHNKKSNIKIDLITRITGETVPNRLFVEASKQSFPYLNAFLTNGFHQLDTPPPRT